MNSSEKDPAKDLFAGIKPEQASVDFTDRLMDRIEVQSETTRAPISASKPIFSATTWLGIASAVLAVAVASFFLEPQGLELFERIPLDRIPSVSLDFSFGLDSKTILIIASCFVVTWALFALDRLLSKRIA